MMDALFDGWKQSLGRAVEKQEKSVDNPYWKDDILEELMPLYNKGYILKVLVNGKKYCILALDSPIQDKGSANRYIIEVG
jgi:hypothetical protein